MTQCFSTQFSMIIHKKCMHIPCEFYKILLTCMEVAWLVNDYQLSLKPQISGCVVSPRLYFRHFVFHRTSVLALCNKID